MNAPRLRFKEFIEKWQVKKLGEITDKIGDGLHSTPVYDENGDYYFINGNNLTNYKVSLFENTKRVNEAEFNKHKVDLNNQTILMSINGTIGNMAFYNGEKVILGKSACYLNLKLNENKEFLFNVLQTSKLKAYFEKELTGSTIKNLSLTTIKNTKIYLPAVPEQTKIANFLTAVDEKIAQLTQKADLLVRYKKGVMQQIFSQQLRFKDDDGQEFPDWVDKSLGEVTSFIKDGTHGTHQDTVDGEYLLLSAKNIKNGGIYYDESDRKISRIEFETIYKNYKLHDGDVLLSVVGTIGRVAIYSSIFNKVAFQRSVAFFRFKNENSQFIAQLFATNKFQNALLTNQVVSAQPGIYLGDLAKIQINLPSRPEQTKIANFLTALDDKISNNQTQLSTLKQYKQGLLQQLFV